MSPPDIGTLEVRRAAFQEICCNDNPPDPQPICQPMCPVDFTAPQKIRPDKRQPVAG